MSTFNAERGCSHVLLDTSVLITISLWLWTSQLTSPGLTWKLVYMSWYSRYSLTRSLRKSYFLVRRFHARTVREIPPGSRTLPSFQPEWKPYHPRSTVGWRPWCGWGNTSLLTSPSVHPTHAWERPGLSAPSPAWHVGEWSPGSPSRLSEWKTGEWSVPLFLLPKIPGGKRNESGGGGGRKCKQNVNQAQWSYFKTRGCLKKWRPLPRSSLLGHPGGSLR